MLVGDRNLYQRPSSATDASSIPKHCEETQPFLMYALRILRHIHTRWFASPHTHSCQALLTDARRSVLEGRTFKLRGWTVTTHSMHRDKLFACIHEYGATVVKHTQDATDVILFDADCDDHKPRGAQYEVRTLEWLFACFDQWVDIPMGFNTTPSRQARIHKERKRCSRKRSASAMVERKYATNSK